MNVSRILAGIPAVRVLVVGDICLDRWCIYDPAEAEPSRETGLPRVAVVAATVTAGAGGTIANNLIALGAKHVEVLGAMGDDGFGFELMRALESKGISTKRMVRSPHIPTFTYTKLINQATGLEDRPRVDFICSRPQPVEVKRELLSGFRAAASAADAVIVSDQAETEEGGCVGADLRTEICAFARRHPEKFVWVDSRKRAELFRSVILKPNRDEAEAASQRALSMIGFDKLREFTESRMLIVTDGANGAGIFHAGQPVKIATRSCPNPVDICGAGDSFTAGAALALVVTNSPADAVHFGNLVASITIMKPGTGTASPEEVRAAAVDWPQ